MSEKLIQSRKARTTGTRVPVSTLEEIKSVAALQGRSPGTLIAEAWREYLANHGTEFAADFETAAQAIRSGDNAALRQHAARFAREQAEAACMHGPGTLDGSSPHEGPGGW